MVVELKNLQVWDKNERLHPCSKERMEELKASLSKNKQILSLLIDGRDNKTILGGNHQFIAMKELGWTEAEAITVTPNDDSHAMELGLKHNSHFAEYDLDELAIDLADFPEIELDDIHVGFGEIDLMGLGNSDVEEDDFDEDVDEVEPIAELGDIYQLGEHRLMCGDSTKIEDVEKLMAGQKADMVFTDPPYGVDFQSNMRTKSEKFDVLKNDDVLLTDWIAPAVSLSTGWILFCTTWKVLAQWLEIGNQIGKLSNMIIWDKGGGGIGDLEHSLSTDYEIILAYNRGNKIHGKRLGSVWSIGKDGSMDYTHPTQKPVALSAQAIRTFSKGSVLDLFGGSGSTLIACEKLNRKCYMMELDPRYVTVILDRWEKLTEKKVKKQSR